MFAHPYPIGTLLEVLEDLNIGSRFYIGDIVEVLRDNGQSYSCKIVHAKDESRTTNNVWWIRYIAVRLYDKNDIESWL